MNIQYKMISLKLINYTEIEIVYTFHTMDLEKQKICKSKFLKLSTSFDHLINAHYSY